MIESEWNASESFILSQNKILNLNARHDNCLTRLKIIRSHSEKLNMTLKDSHHHVSA